MNEMQLYELWKNQKMEDPDLAEELRQIEGDTDAIVDRFYKEMEFGTAGMRGVLGAGNNRMNIYTVRRATQGFANYLRTQYEKPSVAIGYDSRIKSDLFAKEAALVMAKNGVHAYLFPQLTPTPTVSYAVRHLGCSAGIMITASHNPAKYNGYKAYGPDGCQISLEVGDAVFAEIQKVGLFEVALADEAEALAAGTLTMIGPDLMDSYIARVREQSVNPGICEGAGLKVVYTPLNGTGNLPVRRILAETGVSDVTVVPEQEHPDGTFRTCPFPNPEIREALDVGLALAKKEDADLLVATDPDADRIGIAVKDGEDYTLFTGNEVGVMLLYYLARVRTEKGTMPKDPIAVRTVVTSRLTDAIAKDFGVEIRECLTGFKFIGGIILALEEKGEDDRFIFGFEESYGYLAGSYVRDKDAVVAAMLICEMAAWYKRQGISLVEALEALYRRYGYYLHRQNSIYCEGQEGMAEMAAIMNRLRAEPPVEIAGLRVVGYADYATSAGRRLERDGWTSYTIDQPKSNVLAFELEGGAGVVIRPSGTEPKIKSYLTGVSDTREGATALLDALDPAVKKLMGF